MRRARQLASLLVAVAGLWMLGSGVVLGLGGEFGPGPGFFAFGVGSLLAITALLWFGRLHRRSSDSKTPFLGDPGGPWRVARVSLAIVAFAVLVERLGYSVTMLALLVFLMTTFGREHLVPKVLIALAGSFGTHYAFERLLGVPLPSSSIGFLQVLGL